MAKVLTNKMIDNRCEKINEMEALVKELNAKIDALKDELKNDMDAKGVDTINTGNYVLYYREVINNKFDTTALKKADIATYNKYLKPVVTRPFKKYAA